MSRVTEDAGYQPAEHDTVHANDYAVHNMPAYPNGPCDCQRPDAPAELDTIARTIFASMGWNALNQWEDMDPDHPDVVSCFRAADAILLRTRAYRTGVVRRVAESELAEAIAERDTARAERDALRAVATDSASAK